MSGAIAGGGWDLRVTERCLTEDLAFDPSQASADLSTLAAGAGLGAALLRAFLDKRDTVREPDDEGVMERMAGGTPAMFPLRRGKRQRGLTWYDKRSETIWLVAAHHAHDSGDPDDSYAYFRSLRRDQLLPSRADMTRLREDRADRATEAVWDEVPALMRQAAQTRGAEVSGHVGRVPISMMMTDDRPPHLYLAVSRRLEPGGLEPPEPFLVALLAKCYGHPYDADNWLPYDREMPVDRRHTSGQGGLRGAFVHPPAPARPPPLAMTGSPRQSGLRQPDRTA